MDADRSPRRRGRPTERAPWPGSDGEAGRRGSGTDGVLAVDTATGRLHGGDVLTGVLDPDRRAARGMPVSVPEASDLFDQLVSRRPSPLAPTSVGAERTPAAAVDRPRRTRRGRSGERRRLGWAYTMVLAALAVAVAVGVTSRAQLHRTDTQLTEVRARLHQTVGRARTAAAALSAVSAQASSAAQLLATETGQLASVQSQLASTEANVFANGVSINDLDTCLSGVEQALNQISLGDQHDAATTLNGVAASCRAAAPSP